MFSLLVLLNQFNGLLLLLFIKLRKSILGSSNGGKLPVSIKTSGLNSLHGENIYGDVPPDESVTTFRLELFLEFPENQKDVHLFQMSFKFIDIK